MVYIDVHNTTILGVRWRTCFEISQYVKRKKLLFGLCMNARTRACTHTDTLEHTLTCEHRRERRQRQNSAGNLRVGELWCSSPAQDSDDEQRLDSLRVDPDHTRGNVHVCVCGAGAKYMSI